MEIQIQKNVDLKQFTTYHTGGPARFFAAAPDWQAFFHLREFARKEKVPFLILGGGSNVLFADEGYPGMVILNRMDKVAFHPEAVTAEGGVYLMKLIALAAQRNLGGISALANVPGTLGGAVYGNAGTRDLWIGDALLSVIILPENGDSPLNISQEACQFGYRTSVFKKTKDIVLAATLKLKPSPAGMIRIEVNEYIKNRMAKQPVGLSCGSFFKNPTHFPSAGWLIEQAGCKGMKEGGAMVSEKHANFILNTGNATTKDILTLALKVHQMVKEKTNTVLEPEVQIFPTNPFKP